MINDLEGFDREQDLELLRAIDSMRSKQFSDAKITSLKSSQFDPANLALATHSKLRLMAPSLLGYRTTLLI